MILSKKNVWMVKLSGDTFPLESKSIVKLRFDWQFLLGS